MSKQIEAMKLALEYFKQRDMAWNVQIALREALAEQPAPAKPWVDLTVTEQNELCRELGASRHQVRTIEAKLKEKNT